MATTSSAAVSSADSDADAFAPVIRSLYRTNAPLPLGKPEGKWLTEEYALWAGVVKATNITVE
jgi:hypothetical protein